MMFQDGMDWLAGFALRRNRIFGAARVGWPLFCAFVRPAAPCQNLKTRIQTAGQWHPEICF